MGKIPELRISRVSQANNLITEFDNGTFDYIGQSHPQITSSGHVSAPSGSTIYDYHAPQTLTSTCGAVKYAPCDGQYTIWPTANINGPGLSKDDQPEWWEHDRDVTNYWADLRSTTHPMTDPSTDVVTENWDTKRPVSLADNTYSVSSDKAAAAGKFLIVNGAERFGPGHDVVTTTASGLEHHTD